MKRNEQLLTTPRQIPAGAAEQIPVKQLLLPMLKGHWHQVALLFCTFLFTAIVEGIGFSLVVPLLQTLLSPDSTGSGGNFIQLAFSRLSQLFPSEWRLPGLLGLLVLVFMVKSISLIVSSGLTRWFINTLRIDWSTRSLLAYLRGPYAIVAARPHGEVIQTIVGETELAARGVLLLVDFSARLIQAGVLLLLLLLTNWQTTVFVLILGVLAFALSQKSAQRFSIEAGRKRRVIRNDASKLVSETITGLRTIKLLDLTTRRAKALRKMLQQYRSIDTRFEVASGLPSNMIDLIAIVFGGAVILFMTAVLKMRIEEVLPTTALFALVFMRLAASATQLFAKRLQIASSLAPLQAVHEAMGLAPEQLRGSVPFPGFTGEIVFEDVSLKPEGRPVIFDRLNMRIPAVGLTAIVGPSGSGKTTLVDLIVRLRTTDHGRVLVNGRDVSEFDVRSLRARVGYLSQEPQLFDGTVAENLMIGRDDATEAEMLEVARRAHVDEFVSTMEKGYSTELGRSGHLLSGGQRQRLALARELLRRPDLYIFDEPTSALDRDSEAIVNDLIYQLSLTHPVVIISHRQDIIFAAKAIYRIENAKAVKLDPSDIHREGTSRQ
jgi:ABC-type bacteriocin/lantibiotic exporter with double-glycine peptidase domain